MAFAHPKAFDDPRVVVSVVELGERDAAILDDGGADERRRKRCRRQLRAL